MAIRITAVHMVGGTTHQHINNLKWVGTASNAPGENTRAEIVTWLDSNASNRAQVDVGQNAVRVHTVHPTGSAGYLQTYADGKWTNNLLALPRY